MGLCNCCLSEHILLPCDTSAVPVTWPIKHLRMAPPTLLCLTAFAGVAADIWKCGLLPLPLLLPFPADFGHNTSTQQRQLCAPCWHLCFRRHQCSCCRGGAWGRLVLV